MKWFDRKFEFNLPTWMYSNVVERLRGTPARIEDLTGELDKTTLTWREAGSWSIQEHIGHLLDLEPLWLGRIDDFLEGKERLRDADLQNQKTHEAGHNEAESNEILASFRRVRTGFVSSLDERGESAASISAIHPRLEQPMRLLDLIFFVAEHDDHHLARISELKREFLLWKQ